MTKLVHEVDEQGRHIVRVHSDRTEARELTFIFSDEGLIIDAYTEKRWPRGGISQVRTWGNMYDEIEGMLLPTE